ncbi:MAG: hypothetical protein AB1585_00035 [Thermodesulfobacteriota bacterium]
MKSANPVDPIEPGQPYVFDLLQPQDAEGVARLFKTVYGEGYPIRTFIDPQRLIEENKAGRVISSVARTPRGDIVGHNALFCSAPFKRIYETGAGVVHPHYRGGKGIFSGLVIHGLEVGEKQFGAEAIFGESVCNHVFSQKMCHGLGYITQAVEVDLMPAAAYEKEDSAQGRVASIVDCQSFNPNPQTVFVPKPYVDLFQFLYQGLNEERRIDISDRQDFPPESSELETRIFDFAQVARVSVNRAGPDFRTVLDREEKRILAAGVVVIQIWLNLSWPWVNRLVEELRGRKYFIGGLLPRWFDQDGMLMQKIRNRPHWEGIQLQFDRAKKILEWVRGDWEKTLS